MILLQLPPPPPPSFSQELLDIIFNYLQTRVDKTMMMGRRDANNDDNVKMLFFSSWVGRGEGLGLGRRESNYLQTFLWTTSIKKASFFFVAWAVLKVFLNTFNLFCKRRRRRRRKGEKMKTQVCIKKSYICT